MKQKVQQIVIYDIKKKRLYSGDTNYYSQSLVKGLMANANSINDFLIYTKDEFLKEIEKNGKMPPDEFEELEKQVSKFNTIQL